MRNPPSRMTARRRAYRLAGPPPSATDLVSVPLLPYPRARVQLARSAHGMACMAIRGPAQASPSCRRHAGKRRA
ncbi:hypothetical protein CBM2615_B10329 [Cupriavidus taiwanensis]|uniref:Uncharacterized protein n=1 Tax=Cupriavidus taiwanensis TaxID=164546 RepID=A0A375E9P4_9BURK|nr:hypothetical protein [Cupriavidus taiwanensis]SOZ62312.1 hypothetical protein CBM2615_B10329 [Cupriavidus taiwanensis]SOZ62438.1 hypothetical protein CBM2614_B10237 [Cupriavidus taiwanensis]SOZ66530.1 hypothetical protein CBM2613_B10329 [Cupriavidus taiwanensis]SPA07635.1 hypothetical protein CBM2625_B10330 [Cupriavidus taiwanensis]